MTLKEDCLFLVQRHLKWASLGGDLVELPLVHCLKKSIDHKHGSLHLDSVLFIDLLIFLQEIPHCFGYCGSLLVL